MGRYVCLHVSTLGQFEEIRCSMGAFAALRADGQVVTWGDVEAGGALTARVSSRLVQVRDVCASGGAFAALKAGSF